MNLIKLLIFAVAMLCGAGLMAQETVIPTGAVKQLTYQRGGYGADSVFGLPIRDTFCNNFGAFRCKGRITIQPITNVPYYHDGIKWVGFGTGSSIDTSLFLVWGDTVSYIATKYDLQDFIEWADTSSTIVTITQLNDSLANYVKYTDTAAMLDPYIAWSDTFNTIVTKTDLNDTLGDINLQFVTDNGNTTTNGITTGGQDNYSSAIGLSALTKIYKQYADSTYAKYTDTASLASKSWRLGGNTLSQDTAFGTLSNHTINFISNNTQRGRLVSSGEWEFGTRTSNGDVTVQGTNPLSKIYRVTNTVNNTVGWDYQFNNSSSAQVTYAQTRASIVANTAGAQSGSFGIFTANAGTVDKKLHVHSDGRVIIQNGGTFTPATNILLDVIGNAFRVTSNIGSNGSQAIRMVNPTVPANTWAMGAANSGAGTLSGEFILDLNNSIFINSSAAIFGTGKKLVVVGNEIAGASNQSPLNIIGGSSFTTGISSMILGSPNGNMVGSNVASGVCTHVQIPETTGNNQFQPPINSTASYRTLWITPTINQTASGTTGTSAGIYMTPTFTNAVDWRGLWFDYNGHYTIYSTGTAIMRHDGRVGLGGAPDATEAAKITGNLIVTQQYIESVTTSAAGTLTLSTSQNYIFTGTTTTWTLPAVTGTTGRTYKLKNRGSGNVTLNAAAAANEIYTTLGTNTYTLTPGSAIMLVSDGTFFNVE